MNDNVTKNQRKTPSDLGPKQPFSEQSFWDKLKRYAVAAGKDVVELALKLYYVMKDADTPAPAKAVIMGALVYFIVPADAVIDLLPGGYVDDWGALMGALWTVSKHVKDDHVAQAKAKLLEWFPASESSRSLDD
ncbi:DUF1232 domain-containing protein [bacterium]|jgi:uncharacterized membrane protein YkvA (DUF1232 family)|nr:DUF1232 domain-containing protein [bacterium]MDB4493192.1 DUF1232 domain-containing protein [Pseudomonadales bacterium]MDB4576261.1 DUF1232 domain-containing protein [bacterium]MDB4631548.1 DUF1232 domain-containing protein [Pseudomonadales bacterium]